MRRKQLSDVINQGRPRGRSLWVESDFFVRLRKFNSIILFHHTPMGIPVEMVQFFENFC